MPFGKTTKSLALITDLLPLCALIALGGGCYSGPEATPAERVSEAGMSFEQFESLVSQEPESGIYIVDGDTPITSLEGLRAFYDEHVQQGALIVNRLGVGDGRWSDARKLNLTYCVSYSFGRLYGRVAQAMADAAGAWQSAANVRYIHLSAEDWRCTAANANVLFNVNPIVGQRYLARSFFPGQGRQTRNLMIDWSSFTVRPPVTLTGILRHELGHTLGFRHEHTRPESGKCFEDYNWRPLTIYDAKSVMHYPQCHGANRGDLNLTNLDRIGVVRLYGAPYGGGSWPASTPGSDLPQSGSDPSPAPDPGSDPRSELDSDDALSDSDAVAP